MDCRRSHNRAGRFAAVIAVVVAMVCGAVVSAHAESIAVERPVRVVVAPTSFRAFGALTNKEFDYDLSTAYRRGVYRFLANHPEAYEVVAPEEVREKTRAQPVFAETLRVAEEWAKLGTENYKHLRTEDAIRQLENAVEKFDEIDYQYVDPERVAEVAMYLALSYLNQGDNAARPLTLMKRMVRLDPDRVLRKGYYPNKIANFFASARQDLLDRLQSKGPTEARARQLAEMMEAELVVFGTAVPRGDGGYQAKLFVYSAPDEQFVEPESVGIAEATARSYREAGSRLISRVTPCLYRATDTGGSDTIVESQGEGPLSIQLNFVYASFLTYPEPDRISKPFGNLGLSLDAHLALTEEFGVRIGVGVMRSLLDYSGRIVEHLRTVRAQVGPDLAVDIGRFNAGLSVGLEGANVSPFAICEADHPAQEDGCPDGDVARYTDLDFLVGANVRPRLRMAIVDTFDVTAAAGYTFYFVPFTEQPLNNPLSGYFGIKYRF